MTLPKSNDSFPLPIYAVRGIAEKSFISVHIGVLMSFPMKDEIPESKKVLKYKPLKMR